MIALRSACAVALALPFLSSSRPAAEVPTFHPREGLVLDKRFDAAIELTLDRAKVRIHGGETEIKTGLPTGIEVAMSSSLALRDTYEKVGQGRPLTLVRRFDDLELAWRAGDEEANADALEEHPKLAVRFQWNAGDARYDAFFEDVDGQKDILAWFREDADLRGLLPGSAVEVGESWNVPSIALAEVLLPALSLDVLKQLDLHVDDDETLRALAQSLRSMAADVRTECTWRGASTVDGKRLGRIDVSVRGTPSIDFAEMLKQVLEGDSELTAKTARLAVELKGKGELLWDMDAGHFAAFDLKSDVEIELEAELSIDAGDERWTATLDVAASGDGVWSYTAR